MTRLLAIVALLLNQTFGLVPVHHSANYVNRPNALKSTWQRRPFFYSSLKSQFLDDDDLVEEAEIVEPGKMRVSEIKAELDVRGISYKDCFDKESLVERLKDARATGEANPQILDQFNRQKLEANINEDKVEIKDEVIDSAVANDGTLPGGLTPDQFRKLTSNPEIMALLQSTKMQEAMKLMMTEGRDGLDKKLREDPDLRETVMNLDKVLKSMQ